MAEFTWGIIFSVFGITYFGYGKKQDLAVPFYDGIFLMVFPYFIPNLYFMISLGVIGIILPFVWRDV